MKILLDTNFLVTSVKFKIDIFLELKGNELFVTEPVLDELAKIARKKGKDSTAAKMSLEMIKEKNLKVLESKEKEADMSLLDYGKKGYVVATQDKKLREKLRKAGTRIIYIRQKKYVFLER
jgi:rRNA-processing protein FCF1